jgi:serine/threonine protein kinase
MGELFADRYRLGRLLGQGGAGSVYLAFDTETNQETALKLLRPQSSHSPRFAAAFLSEIRAVARLSHPNIVPFFDAGMTAKTPYLSMQYIEGSSFTSLVSAPPPWPRLLEYLSQLLSALSFAHARGLLHRDVKPSNLLLSVSGGVFLADLGLAIESESLEDNTSKEIAGTPAYMAPEQFTGEARDLGPWTDLYSLGVILFELLTGKKPFSGKPLALYQQKLLGAPSFGPREGYWFPDEMRVVLQRLLSPEPLSRYLLAADLARDLEVLSVGSHEARAPRSLPATDDKTLLSSGYLGEATIVAGASSGKSSSAASSFFVMRDPGVVGREEERRLLWRFTQEAIEAGSPRVVLIEGEAGIGKSRLLSWIKEELEQRGLARAILCREGDQSQGSLLGVEGAVHRLLRTYRLTREEALPRVARYLQEAPAAPSALTRALLSWLFPEKGQSVPSESETDALFFALLQQEARRGCVLVCWEDIPLAAESSGVAFLRRLLSLLSRMGRSLPAIFVVTARPSQWGAHRRELLLEHKEVALLTMEKLPLSDMRRLIEERLPMQEALTALVTEHAEGNPLYALELMMHWGRAGWLVRGAKGRYQAKPGLRVEESLPRSLESLATQRVEDALRRTESPFAVETMLLLAALLGLEVQISVLQDAFSLSSDGDGALVLRLLCEEGFLVESESAGVLRFSSRVLRAVLSLRAQDRTDQIALHRACAEALTMSAAKDAATLSLASEHWESAGELLLAAQTSLQAAERFASIDLSSAEVRYQAALRLAGEATREDVSSLRASARLGLGRVLVARQLPSKARVMFEDALNDTSGDRALRSLVLSRLALLMNPIKEPLALTLTEEALQLASADGDQEALYQALSARGSLLQYKGELIGAQEFFTRSYQSAQTANSLRWLTLSLFSLGSVLVDRGIYEEGGAYLSEACRLGEEEGNLMWQCRHLNALGDFLRRTGRLIEARAAYVKAHQISQRLGVLGQEFFSELNLTIVALMERDISQCREHIERARALFGDGAHRLHASLFLLEACVAALAAQRDEASRLFAESVSLGVEQNPEPDNADLLERLGDLSQPPLAVDAYRLSANQWRAIARLQELARVEQKLSALHG